MYQKTGYSQSTTHSRPAECGSRQTIQTRPDNSNRMVSTSRRLSDNMQQVAPTKNRPICDVVQQQTIPVCGTSAGPPGLKRLQDYPCKRIILIALGWPNMPWFWDLVAMSSQIQLSLTNLLTQPFNQTPQRSLSNQGAGLL